VVVTAETDEQRRTRERQRGLFDGVAGLYDATRQGYPAEIVDAIFTTAAISPGAAVLEIGCGTGQLTRQLAGRAFNLTAIDIGAAMVEAARRNVADPMARFQMSSFEDFADSEPLDLIVSATAFHWVDPSIGMAKAARLLRPGGWLAGAADHGGALSGAAQDADAGSLDEIQPPPDREMDRPASLGDSTAANHPVRLDSGGKSHQGPPASRTEVMGVERTRATFLSYSKQDQANFTADLRMLLEPRSHVELVQETLLAMAPAASGT
jgi:SAM-dependent methyltransferase